MFNSALIYELAVPESVCGAAALRNCRRMDPEYLEAKQASEILRLLCSGATARKCRIIPCFGNLLEEAASIPDRSRFNILKFRLYRAKE